MHTNISDIDNTYIKLYVIDSKQRTQTIIYPSSSSQSNHHQYISVITKY